MFYDFVKKKIKKMLYYMLFSLVIVASCCCCGGSWPALFLGCFFLAVCSYQIHDTVKKKKDNNICVLIINLT